MMENIDQSLKILEEALNKTNQVKNTMDELRNEISSRFEVTLSTPNIEEMEDNIRSLASFYTILKNSNYSLSSTKLGFFSLLPVEIILNVFSFLPPNALCHCASVSREFLRLSEENSLWKRLCNSYQYDAFWKPKQEPNWKEVFRWYWECEHNPVSFETETREPNEEQEMEEDEIEQKKEEQNEREANFNQLFNEFFEAELDTKIEKSVNFHRKEFNFAKDTTVIRGCQRKDGSVYKGEWKNGKKHGNGIQIWNEGDIYKGQWKKGKRTGWGIHIWPDGHYYEGYYDEDKRNGPGIFKWPDGREYRGHYVDDQRNGYGKFIWPNGDKYVGMYKESNRNGKGIFTWADGRKYKGEWKDGGYHGLGQYTHRDGCRYKGEWKNNMRSGHGTFFWKDGDSYEGEWSEGKRIGSGRFTLRDPSTGLVLRVLKQQWNEGKFEKHNKGADVEEILHEHFQKKRKLQETSDQSSLEEEHHRSKRAKLCNPSNQPMI